MLNKLQYFAYRFKYVNAPKLNLKKPVDVSIELAARCTNSCSYCYYASRQNLPFKQGMMKRELALKVLKEASEIGVNSYKLNGRGESTLHPNFEEITAYGKSLSSGSTFIDRVTNSNFNFMIDRDDIFRGLLNQTKVKVSFDSFRKDIFEKQRVGSKYEATLANIKKFHDWPGRKTKLVIQSVRTKLNFDEDLESEIKKRFPDALISIRDVVAGRVEKDLKEYLHKDRDLDNRQSCIQAHARLIINHDGKTTVCCPDIGSKIVVGDAYKMSVKEIWDSKQAHEIRKALKDKSAFKNDPCKNCSSYESYKGFKPVWNS